MVISFARTNGFKSEDPEPDAPTRLNASISDAARQRELVKWFPHTPAMFWTETCVLHNGFFGYHTSNESDPASSKITNPSPKPCPASSSTTQTETPLPGGSAGHHNTISTSFRLIVKILKSSDPKYQTPISNESSDKNYIWHEMGFMSFSSDSRSTILCFDVPDDAITGLQVAMSASAEQFGGPFGLHIPLVEELVKVYDHSVWLMAKKIRKSEKVSGDE